MILSETVRLRIQKRFDHCAVYDSKKENHFMSRDINI